MVAPAKSEPAPLTTPKEKSESASKKAVDDFSTVLALVRRIIAATSNGIIGRQRFKQKVQRAGESMEGYVTSLCEITINSE